MPMPENSTLPNPTVGEDAPENMNTRVKFNKTYAYAYGGIRVKRYIADEVANVSELCAETAINDGAAELTDDNLFDPRLPSKTKVKLSAAPENKGKR